MGVFRGVKYELTYEDRVLGGKSKSVAKITASKTNPVKHGKYAKDPEVKEIFTITPKEKVLGITASDKITQLRALNPLFGSKSRIEYLNGMLELLGKLFISALKKEKEGKSADYEYRRIMKLGLEIFDRMYGRPPDTLVNVQQNVNVNQKFDFKELYERAMFKLKMNPEFLEAEAESEDSS